MPQDERHAGDLREVVGVLPDAGRLERTVEDLLTEGFHHSEVSLLGREETVRGALGRYGDTHAAEDDPDAPRMRFIEPESRMEGRGALAGALGYVGAVTIGGIGFATGAGAGAVIAAGLLGGGALGSVGAALGRFLDRRLADRLEDQVRRGGIVIWVRAKDAEHEARAIEVLKRHNLGDVHVHTIPSE